MASKAKSFALNQGKDSNNQNLHINQSLFNTIVCGSKQSRVWRMEERVCLCLPAWEHHGCVHLFNHAGLTINEPDGRHFKFSNYLNVEAINYIEADGYLTIKSVAYERSQTASPEPPKEAVSSAPHNSTQKKSCVSVVAL